MDIWGTVFIIGGIVVGLTLFLYVLPLTRRKDSSSKYQDRSDGISYEDIHYRKCPVCGAKLRENEPVYTITYKGQPEDKTFVKGCDYCFNPRTGKQKKQD